MFKDSPKTSRWQRLAGLCLISLQAVMLGWLSRTYLFPILIVFVAALGAVTRFRIDISRDRAFLLSAAAAFFFLLKHRFAPYEFPSGTEFIRTQVAYIIAQYLLAIQAAQFVIQHDGDRLSPVVPALGAVAMICIADVTFSDERTQRVITQSSAVLYAVFWAMYLEASRPRQRLARSESGDDQDRWRKIQRRRIVSAVAILCLVGGSAWASSYGLYQLERPIERWLNRMTGGENATSLGFSRQADLNSVQQQKTENADQIAVWVNSRKSPGYLRGAVFTRFRAGKWTSMSAPVQGTSSSVRPSLSTGVLHSHPSITTESTDWTRWECWLMSPQDHRALTPLGTSHLATPAGDVDCLPFGVFELDDYEQCNPYTAYVSNPYREIELADTNEDPWLHVTELYQPVLERVAHNVFAGLETPAEKVRAVEAYFQTNYRYQLGTQMPVTADPLVYFLEEKPPAHCEFFATAATLLLRTAGVRARYVTGLVPAERNSDGVGWVARNRDAHAWVEAYVEPHGWITVEPTPSAGVPGADNTTRSLSFWGLIRTEWQRFRVLLGRGNWQQAFSFLMRTWCGLLLAIFLVCFTVYLALRWGWTFRLPGKNRTSTNPQLVEFHRLLASLDGKLQPMGFVRSPGETLQQFASRMENSSEQTDYLQRASRWYHDYASCLYRGQWDGESLTRLKSQLPVE